MDGNVEYVVAGYALSAAAVTGYGAWMWRRIRRARRSLPGRSDA
jgi:cytochrome oxidase assembly protein ShyY1